MTGGDTAKPDPGTAARQAPNPRDEAHRTRMNGSGLTPEGFALPCTACLDTGHRPGSIRDAGTTPKGRCFAAHGYRPPAEWHYFTEELVIRGNRGWFRRTEHGHDIGAARDCLRTSLAASPDILRGRIKIGYASPEHAFPPATVFTTERPDSVEVIERETRAEDDFPAGARVAVIATDGAPPYRGRPGTVVPTPGPVRDRPDYEGLVWVVLDSEDYDPMRYHRGFGASSFAPGEIARIDGDTFRVFQFNTYPWARRVIVTGDEAAAHAAAAAVSRDQTRPSTQIFHDGQVTAIYSGGTNLYERRRRTRRNGAVEETGRPVTTGQDT